MQETKQLPAPEVMGRTIWQKKDLSVLVTGAGGFIGGHLIRALHDLGIARVRGVDVKPIGSWFQLHDDTEVHVGDLSDSSVSEECVGGVDVVFHLAADMGGMGFIARNDVACLNGASIGVSLSKAAATAGVSQILFASSACVYPLRAQVLGASALVESDAYPAAPPEGYGWEKLYTERLLSAYAAEGAFTVRIPRLHNVYGPYGAWRGGREKAPAALSRKIAVAKRLGISRISLWGTGREVRSFCYIDDAIDGLIRLSRDCAFEGPVNLGSEQAVTTTELLGILGEVAEWPVDFDLDQEQPSGVPTRNANTALIGKLIGWQASTGLKEGLARVFPDVEASIRDLSDDECRALLA